MSGRHFAVPASVRLGRRQVLVGTVAASLALAGLGNLPLIALHAKADAAAPPPARTGNLLTPGQASFDSGVGPWRLSTPNTSLAKVATPTQAGAGALALTNKSGTTGPLGAWSGTSTVWTSAVPGFRYTARAWFRAKTRARSVTVLVGFFTSQGVLIDQARGQWRTDGSTSWQQSNYAVGIAPGGTARVSVGLSVAGTGAAETHYADSVVLTEARGGGVRVVGPLRTGGNKILDGAGRPLILRGVNRPGLERPDGGPFTQNEITHAQAWGANVVRIPLGEQLWMPGYCGYDPTYPSRVDAAVRAVTQLGMVALLNLHWSATTPCGKPGLVPGADANAVTFWRQLANRYQANPLVAFDLYNEPHHLTDAIWRYGGLVTWKNVTYRVSGMQQMYNAVRATGATNLVMVSGNTWANLWPSNAPIAGHDIVYAIHLYTCPEFAPPNCDTVSPYDPAPKLNPWRTPSHTYPVMVTEFGWPNPGDGGYIRNLIAYAEAHGWGWSVYAWGSTWGEFSLLASATPASGYEPRPSGMPVLAAFPAR